MHYLRFLAPQIHFDRYKRNIQFIHVVQILFCMRTRDARFHVCERFDRCSFVDVPPCDHGIKGAVPPPSNEGKKVV